VKTDNLTNNEKQVLYGLIKFPNLTDKYLAKKLNLKPSTVTSIRTRLKKKDFYQGLTIPRLQNLGCQILAVIYIDLNPLIPLKERVIISKKSIAVYEELFFSVGAQDKGFSISLSKDYATIGRINDIRTQTFGHYGFIEDEYPSMVIFPFEISKIYRFFDFAPLLDKGLNLNTDSKDEIKNFGRLTKKEYNFSKIEKKVYCTLVKYPESSDSFIGKKTGVSRHTVSKLRRYFEEENLVRRINLPNFKKLGFEILTIYHIRFDPRKNPDIKNDEAYQLISDSTIFMATRVFEAFILSVHLNYDDFNKDTTRIMQILKENKWITKNPVIRTHSLSELVIIKNFEFAPIAKKILNCEIKFE
jgi:DNA-binding MarR family transcriptional regulator